MITDPLHGILDNLPNPSGLSKETHQEFVKLYKAIRRIKGSVLELNSAFVESEAVPSGEYELVSAGIPVTVNGEQVYVSVAT